MATKSFGFHNYQIASVYSNKDLKPCKFYVRWFPSVVCLEKTTFWHFNCCYYLLAVWGIVLRFQLPSLEGMKLLIVGHVTRRVTSKGFWKGLPGGGLQELSFSPSIYNQRTPTPQNRPLSPTLGPSDGPLAGGRGLKEMRVLLWLGGTSAPLHYSPTSPVSASECWKATQLEDVKLANVSWTFKARCWG